MSHLLKACNEISKTLHDLQTPEKPRWFLLWDDVSAEPRVGETGIHVVRYPRLHDTYLGFVRILEYWADHQPVVYRSAQKRSSAFDQHAEPQR